MRIAKLTVPFIFALSLTSCVTTPDRLSQSLVALPEADRGYVIGTYAVGCMPSDDNCYQNFNVISTYYRSAADSNLRGSLVSTIGTAIFGKYNGTIYDFVDTVRREKGIHFCLALPPGDYAVYSYEFYNYAGGGNGFSIREKDQFRLPFTVTKDDVANVGKLKITSATGRNIFGMKLPAPGILMLSHASPEGEMAAMKKCPESIRGRPIREAALTIPAASPTAFVQLESLR